MKEFKSGDRVVKVRANPLALLYYRQAFGSDLIGDLGKMQKLDSSLEGFDSVLALHVTWAMAKAAVGFGEDFPTFEAWVAALESFDFESDLSLVLVEALDGFFRGAGKPAGQG